MRKFIIIATATLIALTMAFVGVMIGWLVVEIIKVLGSL